MSGSVRAVTAETFDEEVHGSPVPVVVDFWAAWCPPCHALVPVLEDIAAEHDGDLRVVSIDTDAHPSVGSRFGVMALPTLIVFDGGEPVQRLVGARGKQHLLAELAPVLSGERPAAL